MRHARYVITSPFSFSYRYFAATALAPLPRTLKHEDMLLRFASATAPSLRMLFHSRHDADIT